jgi:hypothetical protein
MQSDAEEDTFQDPPPLPIINSKLVSVDVSPFPNVEPFPVSLPFRPSTTFAELTHMFNERYSEKFASTVITKRFGILLMN